MAKYGLGNKKFKFYAGVGFSFDFLTKATLTTDLRMPSGKLKRQLTWKACKNRVIVCC